MKVFQVLIVFSNCCNSQILIVEACYLAPNYGNILQLEVIYYTATSAVHCV